MPEGSAATGQIGQPPYCPIMRQRFGSLVICPLMPRREGTETIPACPNAGTVELMASALGPNDEIVSEYFDGTFAGNCVRNPDNQTTP